jgi:2-succinyl-6-hydroxy-2,4-cyclohexadiene-1-carboxylate synthase
MLHGWLGSSHDWDEVLKFISKQFIPITIDLPGHGQSPPFSEDELSFEKISSEIIQLYDRIRSEQLLEENPILVGYSMGGRVALQLAMQYPTYFKGVALIAAHTGISSVELRSKRGLEDDRRAAELTTMPWHEFLENWYGLPIFSSLQRKPDTLAQIMEKRIRFKPKNPEHLLRALSLAKQPCLVDETSKSRPLMAESLPPTLLIAGEEDQTYTQHYNEISTKIGAKVSIVRNAGHSLLYEAPAQLSETINNFW